MRKQARILPEASALEDKSERTGSSAHRRFRNGRSDMAEIKVARHIHLVEATLWDLSLVDKPKVKRDRGFCKVEGQGGLA